MIVVSDSSAIINLDAVSQLRLLQALYGTVLIPPAVCSELAAGGSNAPGAAATSMPWIQTVSVTNPALVATLAGQLDIGEAEAVALALQTHADFLLMDERRGRAAATNVGVKVVGLLGVLVEAKQKRVLPAVRPVLDDLVSKAGFWMSSALYHSTLRAAGE